MSRRKKSVLIIVGCLVGLLLILEVVVRFALPGYARSMLEEYTQDRITFEGLTVSLLAREVTVQGVAYEEAGISIESIGVGINPFVIIGADPLRSISIDGLKARIERTADGTWEPFEKLSDLADSLSDGGEPSASSDSSTSLDIPFSLRDIEVEFVDSIADFSETYRISRFSARIAMESEDLLVTGRGRIGTAQDTAGRVDLDVQYSSSGDDGSFEISVRTLDREPFDLNVIPIHLATDSIKQLSGTVAGQGGVTGTYGEDDEESYDVMFDAQLGDFKLAWDDSGSYFGADGKAEGSMTYVGGEQAKLVLSKLESESAAVEIFLSAEEETETDPETEEESEPFPILLEDVEIKDLNITMREQLRDPERTRATEITVARLAVSNWPVDYSSEEEGRLNLDASIVSPAVGSVSVNVKSAPSDSGPRYEFDSRVAGCVLAEVAKWAELEGIQVTSGSMSLESKGHITGRRIESQHQAHIENLSVSPPEGVTQLFDIKTAAIKNFLDSQQGKLDLEFEVNGDLDNPEFKLTTSFRQVLMANLGGNIRRGIANRAEQVIGLAGEGLEVGEAALEGVGKVLDGGVEVGGGVVRGTQSVVEGTAGVGEAIIDSGKGILRGIKDALTR